MTPEHREYSSISTHIPVWLRMLPDGKSPSLFYEYTAFAHDSLESALASGMPEAVATFLIEMNNKLDSILGMLSMDELRQNFPIEAHCREVGGAGLTFACHETFTQGSYAEAVLVLSRIPLRLAGAIGKLSRSESQNTDPDTPLWRLDFTRIREQDLETVVRFVLQEERRVIREKKWS